MPVSRGRRAKRSASAARTQRSSPSDKSGRYTAPTRVVRVRPEWHKAAGGFSVIAGGTIFYLCYFNAWHLHRWLPGGHAWYIVGVLVAASSLWWFGAFDPPT